MPHSIKESVFPNTTLADIVQPHQIKYSAVGNNISYAEIDAYLTKQFKKVKIDKEDYQAFLYALRMEVEQKYDERRQKQRQIDLLLNKHYAKEKDFMTKANFGENLTGRERSVYEKQIEKFKAREVELTNEKLNISQDTRDEVIEQRAFYELLLNLPTLWKKANYVQKFKLSQILLLNIKIKDGKPLIVAVKPEFKHMFFEKHTGGATR